MELSIDKQLKYVYPEEANFKGKYKMNWIFYKNNFFPLHDTYKIELEKMSRLFRTSINIIMLVFFDAYFEVDFTNW